MREIELTQGLITKVDQEDYDRATQFKWFAARTHPTRVVAQSKHNGKTILLARLITKALPGTVVDHINHDTLDNRKRNLRVTSQKNNSRNRRVNRAKGNRLKGVSWFKHQQKWGARITVNGKSHFLGYFRSKEEAAIKYDDAAATYFKEYAYTNYPKGVKYGR